MFHTSSQYRRLDNRLTNRLRLPIISAPMLRVSGPELVSAACKAGIIGSFPTANAGSPETLDDWLSRIKATLGDNPKAFAPYCPNLIIRRANVKDDLAVLVRHGVEMVITSVGSPEPVLGPLHDIGCLVFSDVASIRHAEKAVKAGADGLVLLTAGAGGNTGWANPFAFVQAVRQFFDGPIVLAGGISDARTLHAARVLGCDLAYMGTRFIASEESMAKPAYKDMVVQSTLDDVLLTRALTGPGLQVSMLRPSLVAAGLDPERLDEQVSEEKAKAQYGGGAGLSDSGRPKRWVDLWSAGHSVSGVDRVMSVAQIVEWIADDYARVVSQTNELFKQPVSH